MLPLRHVSAPRVSLVKRAKNPPKRFRAGSATLRAEIQDQRKAAEQHNTYFLRTIAELRWAIHDLFAYFENHRGGYSHAEAARIEEIRKMSPPTL